MNLDDIARLVVECGGDEENPQSDGAARPLRQ